jgi:vanillate O-demethylase monooxygenase subunit
LSDFVFNAWYVACLSRDLSRELKALTLLALPVVLYRDSQGVPVALEDACPHRKLPLSMGRLKGDHVECGYHGLTFDRLGVCVDAPTQERIPAFACVRHFPVVEKWGMIWIWMGAANLARPEDIPQIDHYDDPAWHITPGDSFLCHCHYLWLTDNLLDPSHVAWVHQSSFAGSGTDSTPLSIHSDEQSVVCSRWIENQAPPPFYAALVKFSGHADRLQHYEVRYPSWAINKTVFTPAGRGGHDFDPRDPLTYIMVSHHFLTPVDADNTHYFWLQHRNTDPHNEDITVRNAEGAKKAFLEDKRVLEAVHLGMKKNTGRTAMMGLDAAALRFRQGLQKILASETAEH